MQEYHDEDASEKNLTQILTKTTVYFLHNILQLVVIEDDR